MFRPAQALLFSTAVVASLLAAPGRTLAEGPPLIIKDVSGVAGDPIVIRAETTGRIVRWKAVTRGVTILDKEIIRDPQKCIVICRRPGVYTIYACTADDKGEPSEIVAFRVIARKDEDDPPEPAPPIPPPPNPPAPVPPPPPVPVPDGLEKKIRDVLPRELTAKDKDVLTTLQAIYLELADDVKDEKYTSTGMFLTVYRKVAEKMIPGENLLEARKVAAAEVYMIFPKDTETPLTSEHRSKGADLFRKLAAIFGSIK